MNIRKVKAAIETLETLKFKIDFECSRRSVEIGESNEPAQAKLEAERMKRMNKINDVIRELERVYQALTN